jgi:hypothetical protein
MPQFQEDVRRLLDLEEIKQLKYRYCHHNDGGWPAQPKSHQGPSEELFTEDGVWDGRPLAPLAQGRAEIRKVFTSLAALPLAYHAVMNPIIELEGDFARAHWHIVTAGESAQGEASLSVLTYEDEYVRTPQGWRISLMRLHYGRTALLPGGWQATMGRLLET